MAPKMESASLLFPPDEELGKILLDYERRALSLPLRIRYLQQDHHIYIGLTKLKALNKKFRVPSARKFVAVEEATAAITEIISRDLNQGQGTDTVKKIASLRLNLTVPRDFVRTTMKGLVGQLPTERRKPGRGKGPKQRSTLNAIGIFQEIHADGWVTFDGGSELGWLAAFQTTLRETFAPELSAEGWKPFVAVQSSSNSPIESTWSYDHKFNGRTIHDVLEEGRIHLIPGDVIHKNLFRWLWPKIVQIGLDEFLDYFNNEKTRKQRNRILPSSVAPNVVFDMSADYGLQNLAIPVTHEAIQELCGLIETSREEAFR
ncbi:hypothetical protein K438DRAFT_1788317 [Mycena galopus ATCC 62051]|nr:hypothetical protein K438DRAFT_1788317 [Mycena galopus ATCC 62051]